MTTASLNAALAAACADVGIVYRDVPADGRFHETDVEDDRRGRADGRVKLFPGVEGGIVCNGKGERKGFFAYEARNLSGEERAELVRKRREAVQRANKIDVRARQSHAIKGGPERMREALGYVPANDRDTWVRMGMAVKSALGDSGFDIWDAWSQAGDSYNARDARDTWRSVSADGKVTIASLFHEAKAHGWVNGSHRAPSFQKGGGGVLPPRSTLQPCNAPPGLTLDAYADAKKLPMDFLRGLGLADLKMGNGKPAVRVPYRDSNGKEVATRYRHALTGGGRFTWKKGSRQLLYGAWDAGDLSADVLLVEGESDCHTLWHHGFSALGLPGAAAWKEERDLPVLAKAERVYVVIEPDRGGEAVKSWLAKSALRERAFLVRLEGAKDVSELHLADPSQFKPRLQAAMQAAVPFAQEQARQQRQEAAEAWAACRELAEDDNILGCFATAFRGLGAVGEGRAARIIYLALTSRFLRRPVSVAVKGPSSGGKSFLTDTVLRFFPEEAVYQLTAMSERALAYTEAELAHRFIYIAEAAGIVGDMQTYLIRTLLSEGRLVYELVEKTSDGMKPRRIEKEGPTGLLVTTTAVRLHPENETRMLSLHVTDTREQTRAVLAAIAEGGTGRPADLSPWLALQTWLARAEHRVVIPYASELAKLIPPVAVRLRRDFGALLALVRAHAILHQARRERDADGRIVATVTDYAAVRELVAPIISEGVGATVPTTIRETIAAVARLIDAGTADVSVVRLAQELKLDKSATSRRVSVATAGCYLQNLEERKGRPARLILGDKLPDETEILPSVEALQCCSVARGGISPLPPPPEFEEVVL